MSAQNHPPNRNREPKSGNWAGQIDVIALSNNRDILQRNLLRSPAIASKALELRIVENAISAGLGYNQALDQSRAPVAVLAHQDVYLPPGWDGLLRKRIAEVSLLDPDWAIIAPFGLGDNTTGYGPVWSTSIGQIVGRVSPTPVPMTSADELLLVFRRAANVRFDGQLPGFHLYGTDIVQATRARGLQSYVTSLPLIHNDAFKPVLDASFAAAFHYLRRKWRTRLPIQTPITEITWHGLNLKRQARYYEKTFAARRSMALSNEKDPRHYASLCGWSNLLEEPNLKSARSAAE